MAADHMDTLDTDFRIIPFDEETFDELPFNGIIGDQICVKCQGQIHYWNVERVQHPRPEVTKFLDPKPALLSWDQYWFIRCLQCGSELLIRRIYTRLQRLWGRQKLRPDQLPLIEEEDEEGSLVCT